jgi:parvulin-like peptidyl-prolyl isomerase
VDSKVIVRDEEIREYYQKNRREFLSGPEMAEVKTIFLKLREDATVTEITDLKLRALRITMLLKDGYNFDSLVDEYSDEPLRSEGGNLGKFARGSLIPPLDDQAFSMDEGGISDPIWAGEGVYILQIASKSGETFKTFDEVKEEIYGALYRQKREKAYNEWIKALWEKSSVTINQN